MALEQLLRQRPDIWRGTSVSPAVPPGIPTGFSGLDGELPGGGWPEGAVSDILCDGPAGFSLVMPALARLSRMGRWLLLVAPPHVPYAPALAGRGLDLKRLLLVREREEAATLWAAEQGLRSGACGAVLTWSETAGGTAFRRLQLAAEAGGSVGFVFRGEAAAEQASPAPLRVRVRARSDGVRVRVLKRRGGVMAGELVIGL